MSEKPPAYDGAPSQGYGDEKKREKREITLLHSDLTGASAGPETSLLFPPNTTLIRIWSGQAVDGIEYVSAEGTSQLLGSRTGSVTDHRVPVNTYITACTVRSGAWIDAIQLTFSNGSQTAWCGGPGGGQVSWSGVIVGIVAQTAGNILGRIGVITATEYREFAQFYHDTQANGIAAEEAQHQDAGPSHQQQQHEETLARGKYTWDTGRWTRNRGIGVRWNHERRRVEIYQGSNDAKKY